MPDTSGDQLHTTGGAVLKEFPGCIFNWLKMKIGNDIESSSRECCWHIHALMHIQSNQLKHWNLFSNTAAAAAADAAAISATNHFS